MATLSGEDDKIDTEKIPFPSENTDEIMEDRTINEIIDNSPVPAPPTLETNPYATLVIDGISIDSIEIDVKDFNEDIDNMHITESSINENFDKDSAK